MQPTQNTVEPTYRERVEIARTLGSVALYLRRHGWIRGSYYDQSATVFTPAACTVGALAMVCYGGPVEAPAQMFNEPGFDEFETAVAFLDRELSDRWNRWAMFGEGVDVYTWNDQRVTGAEQVIATLVDIAAELYMVEIGYLDDDQMQEVADALAFLDTISQGQISWPDTGVGDEL